MCNHKPKKVLWIVFVSGGILLIIIHIHLLVWIDDGSSWLIGQLNGHCCVRDFCVNVCCVCSCIPSQYWKWLKMCLEVNNGAEFGISVIWSVVMMCTVVITVACGLAVTWHCSVCKIVCCCIVVDIRSLLSEKKKMESIYFIFIYWFVLFVCLFVNVFVQRGNWFFY